MLISVDRWGEEERISRLMIGQNWIAKCPSTEATLSPSNDRKKAGNKPRYFLTLPNYPGRPTFKFLASSDAEAIEKAQEKLNELEPRPESLTNSERELILFLARAEQERLTRFNPQPESLTDSERELILFLARAERGKLERLIEANIEPDKAQLIALESIIEKINQ